MKKIQFPKTKNKIIVLVAAFIVLLAASQWWTIKMIYAHKINGETALFFARLYHLTAGRAVGSNEHLTVGLADYLRDETFALDYVKKEALAQNQDSNISDVQIKEMVWDKILKQTWVASVARKNKIAINDQDFQDFYNSTGGMETMKTEIEKLSIDFKQYEDFVVRPTIMEAKVYKFLLENFSDMEGMQKAQNAYKALVDENKPFKEVATQFSEDTTYVDNSLFVSDEQLGEFGQPIKDLKVGDYSKIMVLPGNPGYYVIWHLLGIAPDPETQQDVKELRGIIITAKSMDQFFGEWKDASKISQWYK